MSLVVFVLIIDVFWLLLLQKLTTEAPSACSVAFSSLGMSNPYQHRPNPAPPARYTQSFRAMHSQGNRPRLDYKAYAPHLPPYAGTPRCSRFYMGSDPIHREKMLANARMRMEQQEITPQQLERMERNRIIALTKKANNSQYAAQVRLDSASAASVSSNHAVAAMPAYEGGFGSPEDIEACEIIAREDEKENVIGNQAAAADDDQKPPAKKPRPALPTPKQLHKATALPVQPMICQDVAGGEVGCVDDVAPPDDGVHDARNLTEVFFHRGHAYSKGNSLKDKREYRCCNARHLECKSRLFVDDATGAVSHPKNCVIEHSDACKVANGFGPSAAERGSGTRNVTRDMFIYVDTLASVQGNISASKIADDCLLHFNTLYPDGYFGYKRNQLVARAYNTNRQSRGGCEIVGLEKQHMANADGGGTAVLRGNVAFTEPNRRVKSYNQQQRVVTFSHPTLMKMMKSDKVSTAGSSCNLIYYPFFVHMR